MGFVLTGGQVADTITLPLTLSHIRVPTAGRPRMKPDRLLADRGYPLRSNRAWLREQDVKATIPERDNQIVHRRKRRGRPIKFDAVEYTGRNVVERCLNRLKQWRGIDVRSDKTARNYHAAICLAATLHWVSQPNLRGCGQLRDGSQTVHDESQHPH